MDKNKVALKIAEDRLELATEEEYRFITSLKIAQKVLGEENLTYNEKYSSEDSLRFESKKTRDEDGESLYIDVFDGFTIRSDEIPF